VNRARTLLAFWLLALAAAVIAALGLRAAGAEVRTDTPTQRVTPSSQPARVLGSVPRPKQSLPPDTRT
jgi:hypothetical protein